MWGVAMIFWLVWMGIMVAALVAFFRGMAALTRIADRMERIERILEARTDSETGRAI
jgi:uncharacterized membrane protein YdjX (TVP38/TMEM64 family)